MLNKNVSKTIIGIVFVLLVLQAIQSAAAKAPDILNNSCEDCHLRMTLENETLTNNTYTRWSVSTHALFNVSCEKCHGGDPLKVSKDEAHMSISKEAILSENIPDMCGNCHEMELNEFKSSKHYRNLESGQAGQAPSCITCHEKHNVRVLTSSELLNFCIICHNIDTGINPSVPGRAKKALDLLKDLQLEIPKARAAINLAKTNGKDVTAAEEELGAARLVLQNAPSVWHRFNLTYFDTEVQKGMDNAKNAEKTIPEATATQIPTAKSPGFGIFMQISILIAAYLKMRFK